MEFREEARQEGVANEAMAGIRLGAKPSEPRDVAESKELVSEFEEEAFILDGKVLDSKPAFMPRVPGFVSSDETLGAGATVFASQEKGPATPMNCCNDPFRKG